MEEYVVRLERLRLLRRLQPLLTSLERALQRGDVAAALEIVRELDGVVRCF